MVDPRPVGFLLGIFLAALAAAMLLPALADAEADNPDWKVFVISSAVTLTFAGFLVFGQRVGELRLDPRQAFLITVVSWVAVSGFAALPFRFASLELTYSDAFFEAISGLTTTGSTVLSGLDRMPPGILLWRSLLQWMGGFGIIAMAVAVLPFLGVGGMQLFRSESSDRSEKIVPRPGQLATRLGLLYGGLTLLCAWAYWLAGMTGFEATAHAMTTVSTGGYSTSDSSLGHFSPAAQWIAVAFMLLGALPFVLLVRAMRGRIGVLYRDSQVQTFLFIVCGVTLSVSLWLWWLGEMPAGDVLRRAAFNVVSIVTTTGYASADYSAWGGFAVVVFFLLTFVGGCTGSTAGGFKIFRLEIMAIAVRVHIRRLILPNGVFPMYYNRRALPTEVSNAVIGFLLVFLLSVALLTLALATLGLDLVTSLSGAATAIANVGPGLGPIIGPAGNFSSLPDPAKWLLSIGMLLGRLELFTVMVLLLPRFWVL